jgi:hypothetical protein
MLGNEDLLDIPDDVLEEILEEEEKPAGGRGKAKYPSARDIVEAVKTVALTYRLDPDSFPETVIKYLEEQGFDARHVTVKRIWRTYEKLVRTGQMRDALGVVWG